MIKIRKSETADTRTCVFRDPERTGIMLDELENRKDKIDAIRETMQDLLENIDEIDSIVLSYQTFDNKVWSFNCGSIPTNIGMLETLKKEILHRWEVE